MSSHAERMMSLFRGFSGAHGTHGRTKKNDSKGGKLEIKETARTVQEPVTVELWEKHLSGEKALGIIPIDERNECVWGCIDVDRYDIDHADIVKEIRRRKLPLVLARTKSGGAHAYLFLSSPAPAADVRATLKGMAASMGWGDCEIFPKQTQVLLERGDLGSWLNMPYLGGNKTERYAVKETMAAYSIEEFLAHAESMRVSIDDAIATSGGPEERGEAAGGGDMADGPPCLENLTQQGFPEGTRNNGLFAMGIYCKKKYGEHWKQQLEEMNRKYMKPPLAADEVISVLRSLEKKDYNYSCREQPLCSFCNSTVCRGRKFGVGGSGLYPHISGLAKLDTQPPVWFMDIEDRRVELTTSELQNYRLFQHVCMDQLTVFYMPIRMETWVSIVGEAMQNAIIIEASADMSIHGHFMELLEMFCMDRHRGERWEDIHQGRPYLDPDTASHWFRLKDFMSLLEREGFRHYGRNKVGQLLTEMGSREGRNIGGKYVNLFMVPEDAFDETPSAVLPPAPKEPV